jgi:hypothetical protein
MRWEVRGFYCSSHYFFQMLYPIWQDNFSTPFEAQTLISSQTKGRISTMVIVSPHLAGVGETVNCTDLPILEWRVVLRVRIKTEGWGWQIVTTVFYHLVEGRVERSLYVSWMVSSPTFLFISSRTSNLLYYEITNFDQCHCSVWLSDLLIFVEEACV